jgi:hypothetical protein
MPKSLSRGRARLCLSVAAGLLASPLALAAAPDPFAPFPVAEGETSDPRIEVMRESLRPGTFKPAHEVVITDEMFFLWKDVRSYVKQCGGKPSLTNSLPKEPHSATPFRARFENPQAPIRAYAGTGYACTFPARLGPLAIGYDAPVLQGLITYSDGSYWLGEVSGAANANARESVLYAEATPLTPTPAGVGEWGRPDGSRVQGVARPVALAEWPNRGWDSTSVVSFEMSSVQRAALPDGSLLAGKLRIEDGRVVAAQAAPAVAVAAAPAAEAASVAPAVAQAQVAPAATAGNATVPTPAPAAAQARAEAASPASSPVAATPAPAAAMRPAPAPATTSTDPALAGDIARIERWRKAMQSFDPASARQSVATVALGKNGDFKRYAAACGSSAQPQPFRLTFDRQTKISEFIGFTYGCVLPKEPSDGVFGLIRYADGMTWLGQVTASPQAKYLMLGAFGVTADNYHLAIPVPNGLGEVEYSNGTRLQLVATPVQAEMVTRDNWIDGPLGAFAPQSLLRVLYSDGVEVTGDLRLVDGEVESSQGVIRWPDGRIFTGSIAKTKAQAGVLAYPDFARISGTLVVDDQGITQWEAPTVLNLTKPTQAGPPGRYLHASRIRFDTPSQDLLEVRGARPIDAETLAQAGRNTRQCPQPPSAPSGWVAWWPSCEPGAQGRVALYSPDATQELIYFPAGNPKRFVLRKGVEKGMFYGVEILADAFSSDGLPSPVGEAEMRVRGEAVFSGNFVAQQPSTGFCATPANEGGGWEACEYFRGARVDMAHTLRQERRELARQQEELRRQMEQEAEAERYAQEQWEYEQEQAEQREQKRQDEIAGQMAIANAIRGAAYDIGMAYAEREAARDAADYRERQAAREAARPSYSPAPSSSGGYGSSGQGANERAAQLAARQAELERRQAELRQRQALASAPRPAPTPAASYGSGAGSSSSPGSVGSTEPHGFTIADHNVGRVSATRQILGLAVTLEVRRVGLRISGADRSEICANFENRTAANWSGGYRLTDRDARDTHASMSVPAGGTARKCETLNPQTGYTVVLRQDRG